MYQYIVSFKGVFFVSHYSFSSKKECQKFYGSSYTVYRKIPETKRLNTESHNSCD